ncbi:MAG: hypothetical protein JSR58_03025 [Verrucomicrobia bacterium]|nr:hypothetical protein [Verrucomicrobiota bacterium]
MNENQTQLRTFSVTLRFCHMHMEFVLRKCEDIASHHFAKNGAAQQFSVNSQYLTVQAKACNEEIRNYLQNKEIENRSKIITELRKLSQDLWQPSLERAHALMGSIFLSLMNSTQNFTLPRTCFQKEENRWTLTRETLIKYYEIVDDKIYESFGHKQQGHTLTFTTKDYEQFDVRPGVELIRAARDLICSEFALFQIQEKRAKDSIFYPGRSLDIIGLMLAIQDWNYMNVLEPKENDLVVYLHEDKPTHVGVWTKSGKVQSKFGNVTTICEHPIFDVPTIYGTEVIFLRKS